VRLYSGQQVVQPNIHFVDKCSEYRLQSAMCLQLVAVCSVNPFFIKSTIFSVLQAKLWSL
jgi:hypothetical protein